MTISPRKAYTLVEIMIVVAVIAVLLAIAVPNYLKTGKVSAKTVCINNLKQIDGAIERWALDHNIKPGIVPNASQEDQIYGYIDGGKPKCPSKGSYVIYGVDDKPQVRCTREDEGHKLPE